MPFVVCFSSFRAIQIWIIIFHLKIHYENWLTISIMNNVRKLEWVTIDLGHVGPCNNWKQFQVHWQITNKHYVSGRRKEVTIRKRRDYTQALDSSLISNEQKERERGEWADGSPKKVSHTLYCGLQEYYEMNCVCLYFPFWWNEIEEFLCWSA